MTKYQVITNIMNSDKIGENDKVYFIEMYLKGWSTENDVKWIWED